MSALPATIPSTNLRVIDGNLPTTTNRDRANAILERMKGITGKEGTTEVLSPLVKAEPSTPNPAQMVQRPLLQLPLKRLGT